MSAKLKHAEKIARDLKFELQGLSDQEAHKLLRSRLDELPDEYKALVDGFVAAALTYGRQSNSNQPKVERGLATLKPLRLNLSYILLAFFIFPIIIIAWLNVQPTVSADGGPSQRDMFRNLRDEGRENLIVFVHGLRDDGQHTWSNDETKAIWPEMLSNDIRFDSFDIATYHYSSALFQNRGLSISNVADQLAIRLDTATLEKYHHIVFVAHSMGGIVVRNLLLKSDEIANKVPLVYFLATPTAGADIAKLAQIIDLNNRQLDALTSFEASNFLEDQNSSWRASNFASNIYSLCAFESKATRGFLVVDQASAQSLCTGRTVPSGESHSGISKPYSQESIVYKAFADHVAVILQEEK